MEYVKCCKCGKYAGSKPYDKIPGLMCEPCAIDYEHELYRGSIAPTAWDAYIAELHVAFADTLDARGGNAGAR